MLQPDYTDFFTSYVDVFNRSIRDSPDTDAIRASYAEYFVSAGAGGAVTGGANDGDYAEVLRKGAEFYRQVGMLRMNLTKVEVTQIDAEHDMARPYFRADYRKKDGTPVSIEFDLVYLLQRRQGGPKIFAFVTGDEMALHKQNGLIDDAGNPA